MKSSFIFILYLCSPLTAKVQTTKTNEAKICDSDLKEEYLCAADVLAQTSCWDFFICLKTIVSAFMKTETGFACWSFQTYNLLQIPPLFRCTDSQFFMRFSADKQHLICAGFLAAV